MLLPLLAEGGRDVDGGAEAELSNVATREVRKCDAALLLLMWKGPTTTTTDPTRRGVVCRACNAGAKGGAPLVVSASATGGGGAAGVAAAAVVGAVGGDDRRCRGEAHTRSAANGTAAALCCGAGAAPLVAAATDQNTPTVVDEARDIRFRVSIINSACNGRRRVVIGRLVRVFGYSAAGSGADFELGLSVFRIVGNAIVTDGSIRCRGKWARRTRADSGVGGGEARRRRSLVHVRLGGGRKKGGRSFGNSVSGGGAVRRRILVRCSVTVGGRADHRCGGAGGWASAVVGRRRAVV